MAQTENYEEQIGKKKLGLAPPNINVTPLVDVLLVLLIIFFVIQPRKEAKFESQIPSKPEESSVDVVPPQGLLLVDVKTGSGLDQMVELNSTPISLIELGPRLKAEFDRRELEGLKDNTVYVKAKKDKMYGDIVEVIDVLKGAGAQPIGLQIDYLDN